MTVILHINYNTKVERKIWIEKNEPKEELLEHKKKVFDNAPLISIIVPVYETPLKFLKEMITSVVNQTYSNWELRLADGESKAQYVEDKITENGEKRCFQLSGIPFVLNNFIDKYSLNDVNLKSFW